LLLLAGVTAPGAEPAKKPNVIVVFSDDHGWADLGANGSRTDVKTPHLDQLAKDGVRFTRGYVTAPQCVPSRAGLITGRYQQRCGVDDNLLGPLPKGERTIAHMMAEAGFRTGMVGKWHLDLKMEPAEKGGARQPKRLPDHLPHKFGFQEIYCGEQNNYHVTHDLNGKAVEGGVKLIQNKDYRVDVQTAAALSFIDRNAQKPFFLYLAYFAPHVPSEAPAKYLDRFKEVKDEKRRVGLAMVSAVDDGIGEIRARLRKHGLDQNTLIVFIGDNGAPTKPTAWNGSLNDPLVGEKGMVTDGGVRVPFLAAWPAGLPKGAVYEKAVSSLDVLPTALAACGSKPKAEDKLDGVSLLPFLTGVEKGAPHPQLFWRWRSQAAVLEDNWKLVFLAPDQWRLFDTTKPVGEKEENDLASKHPEKVADLKKKLIAWDATLKTPGLPKVLHPEDKAFFDKHLSILERPNSQNEMQ